MLIQLPSGSTDQPGPQNAEQGVTFEAGLRRDLASAPVVSYDSMLGGVGKRAVDLALTLIAAPLWAPVLLLSMGSAKLRHGAAITKRECVGYGGRAFELYSLPVKAAEADREKPPSKWRHAFERLPRLINVIKGDLALVGPAPLTREALEPLRSARRYYLSARPGLVGTGTIIGGSDDPSQYKIYAMSWAVTTDALILWDALRSLFKGDNKLWRPSFKTAAPGQSTSGVVVRRRSAE